MAYAQRVRIDVVTASDGSATAYSEVVTGILAQLRYVKTDFADGVDFTVTAEATGETLWAQENVNASVTVAPRQALHTTAGAAALYASGGTAVLGPIALANDRIKVVVANGGSAKSGTIWAILL